MAYGPAQRLAHQRIRREVGQRNNWPFRPVDGRMGGVSDGHALGTRGVDYGMLVKIFREPRSEDRRKYSPSKIIGSKKQRVFGVPSGEKICTSHTERLNGSIRTFNKRMSRLTYCFSKRWANHRAALGLFFCHYNWCRKHKSLKGKTPAFAHGLTNHARTVRELLERVMA